MTYLHFLDNHLQIFHALYELVPEMRHELDRLTEDGNAITETRKWSDGSAYLTWWQFLGMISI
jgi:hypothetical protein